MLLAIINLIDGVCTSYVTLHAAHMGASSVIVGALFGIASLPWLCAPIFGAWVDRRGSWLALRWVLCARWILLLAIAIFLAGLTIFGSVTLAQESDVPPVQGTLHLGLVISWFFLCVTASSVDMATDLSVQTLVGNIFHESTVPSAAAAEVSPHGDYQQERAYSAIAMTQTTFGVLLAPTVAGYLVTVNMTAALLWLSLASLACFLIGKQYLHKDRFSGEDAFTDVSPSEQLAQPTTKPPVGTTRELIQEVVAGFKDLLSISWLRRTALLVGTFNFVAAVSGTVSLLYLTRQLSIETSHIGIVWSIVGGASVFGAWLAGKFSQKLGSAALILIGGFALALDDGALLISENLAVIATIWCLTAMLAPCFSITVISTRQKLAPQASLARINATFQTIGIGVAPLGGLVGGVGTAHLGYLPLLAACVAVNVCALLCARPWNLPKVPQQSVS